MCLQKDTKAIKIEARSGVIENYNNHIVAHMTNEEKDTIEIMIRWVKSARVLRKNTRKVGNRKLGIFINDLRRENTKD